MTADMSVIGLLLDASMPVQIVILLLIWASVASWSIIFTKRRLIRRTTDASDEFEAAFWSGGTAISPGSARDWKRWASPAKHWRSG